MDDEPEAVELLEFNLKKAGFEVITATDGAQAVRQVGIEEQQQRNQNPPRQYAARCVDRRKLRPDDVADAQGGGAVQEVPRP